MKTVFIFHGAYGSPEENWIPWLKDELEKLGCRVFVPKFPTPKNQSLANWLKVFEKYQKYMGGNSIVVTHSLGAAFLFSVLEKRKTPINSAFLISGFLDLLGNPTFDNINKTFVDKKFDWKKIRTNCQKFYLYRSDNDPYVPLKLAEKIAKNLKVKINIVIGAGHFNKAAGYTKFELLLEKIRKI